MAPRQKVLIYCDGTMAGDNLDCAAPAEHRAQLDCAEDRVYSDEEHAPLSWGGDEGGYRDDIIDSALGIGLARHTLGFRPTLTARGRNSRAKPHRRLYSGAVAAGPAAETAPPPAYEQQPRLAAQQTNVQPVVPNCTVPSGWAQAVAAPPPVACGAAAGFLGRAALPRRPTPARQVHNEVAQLVEDTTSAAVAVAPMQAPLAEGEDRPPARGPPADAAPPKLAPVENRTDDGLNVVFLRRRQQGQGTSGDQGPAAQRSVNTGWGNNFVRIDMKVCTSSTTTTCALKTCSIVRNYGMSQCVFGILFAERSRQHKVCGQPPQQQARTSGSGKGAVEDFASAASGGWGRLHGGLARVSGSMLQVWWQGSLGQGLHCGSRRCLVAGKQRRGGEAGGRPRQRPI